MTVRFEEMQEETGSVERNTKSDKCLMKLTELVKKLIFQLKQVFSWERVLIIISVFASIIFVFYLFYSVQNDGYFATMEKEGTRTLILFLAGTVGWYFLLRRTIANEKSVSVEQLTRAMEQIAKDKLSIQLGGILGLKKIAESQKEERKNIIQIFIARIYELTAEKDRSEEPLKQNKRQIITVAVIAISEIARYLDPVDRLKVCVLQRADLSNLFFYNLDFSCFILGSTKFQHISLSEISFQSTILGSANFSNAQIKNSAFNNAILDDANFINAKLVASNFTEAHLRGAVFENTDISSSNFKNAIGLTQKQLDAAYYMEGSPPLNLPDGLKLPPERKYQGENSET